MQWKLQTLEGIVLFYRVEAVNYSEGSILYPGGHRLLVTTINTRLRLHAMWLNKILTMR